MFAAGFTWTSPASIDTYEVDMGVHKAVVRDRLLLWPNAGFITMVKSTVMASHDAGLSVQEQRNTQTGRVWIGTVAWFQLEWMAGFGLEWVAGLTGICIYCGQGLTNADVDHFVPFSQYPRDLAHNFVLAHPTCNRSKSDTLAAGPHLERWLERLVRHADALTEIGQTAGMIADVQVSRQIAFWGYTSAVAQGGHAWLSPTKYELIDVMYAKYFTS